MLTWALVKRIREELSCDTKDVTCAIDELKYASRALTTRPDA